MKNLEQQLDAELDALMRIIPHIDAGHMFFKGIVSRFRENQDWQVDLDDANSIVHKHLNLLEKTGRIVVRTHPNSPLFYSRITGEVYSPLPTIW